MENPEVCGCGLVFKDREEGNIAEDAYTELRWDTRI